MASRVTFAQFAAQVGVTASAISKAVAAGRLTADADGLLDPVAAAAQWAHNRRRQRRPRVPPAGDSQAAPAAADYWQARTERELAEARMATMREAEMRGELVRAAEVEREIAGRLVALRDALETVGARIGAILAAESDAASCARITRAEIRSALEIFTRGVEQ